MSEFELDRLMAHGYACDCQSSPFISDYHGHVITGNLNIISNEALRKVVSKDQNLENKTKQNSMGKRQQ